MSSPQLKPPAGANRKNKRLGRGRGSGLGKTSGRGTKGFGARSGSKKRPWFEGGQMPLQRRVPKRGFKPLSYTEYQVVNLATLAQAEAGSDLSPKDLADRGWIKKSDGLIKILGNGDLPHAVSVTAHAFSETAREKIEKAGGSAKVITRASVNAE